MALFDDRSRAGKEALARRLDELEARCGADAGRAAELEARCAELAGRLEERDAEVKRLGVAQAVLARRLDEAAEQSAKLASALLERMDAVARRGAASSSSASAAASVAPR